MNLINTEIKIGALVFLHAEIFYIGLVFLIVLIVSFYYSSKKKQILANITKKYLKHFYFSRVISYLKIILSFVIYIVFLLLLSDPRYLSINEKVKKDGIDIFLALDVSKSMEATDLKPSRIEAAKTVIRDFVSEIKSDRV
jgi:Ca-activated chloride channel family protein